MKKQSILRLANAGMLFALGLVLPFLTGQIPEIGNLLLPMHLPVLLCGFVCGGIYGSIVGFTLPLVRSLIFGMPALFPSAVTMAFELMPGTASTNAPEINAPKEYALSDTP